MLLGGPVSEDRAGPPLRVALTQFTQQQDPIRGGQAGPIEVNLRMGRVNRGPATGPGARSSPTWSFKDRSDHGSGVAKRAPRQAPEQCV